MKAHKSFTFNFGKLITLSGAFYVAYCLLLDDSILYFSLAAIIEQSHELSMHTHLMVLGLIPIYIAIVIFGAATIGVYLGGIIEKVVIQPIKNLTLSALKARS